MRRAGIFVDETTPLSNVVDRLYSHAMDDGKVDKEEQKAIDDAHKRQLIQRQRGPAQVKAYRQLQWMKRVSGGGDANGVCVNPRLLDAIYRASNPDSCRNLTLESRLFNPRREEEVPNVRSHIYMGQIRMIHFPI